MLNSTDDEPNLVEKAFNSVEGILWKDAMVEEMESLHKNETWDLVKLPSGIKHVSNKWVFKKKMNTTSQVEKLKDQLVAKGYYQVEGVELQ
jgi:hypothetical protein